MFIRKLRKVNNELKKVNRKKVTFWKCWIGGFALFWNSRFRSLDIKGLMQYICIHTCIAQKQTRASNKIMLHVHSTHFRAFPENAAEFQLHKSTDNSTFNHVII